MRTRDNFLDRKWRLHIPRLLAMLSALVAAAPIGAAPAAPATATAVATADGLLNLNAAVLVTPATTSVPEQKAIDMLLDEVEKRTLVRWDVVHEWPATAQAVIAVGVASSLPACGGPLAAEITADAPKGPEGYVLRVLQGHRPPTVLVVGSDSRGMLFGVGRLLRELRMTRNSVSLSSLLTMNTTPRCAIRGHQIGYRPKVNTYDGWTIPFWEQYFRDLIVFGVNSIELIPPRSDDDADSPHFPLPQIEMMKQVSQLADDYGLSVGIWYPALDKDYTDPATVEAALKEWGAVFEQLPRIDSVFVPGGDPGNTPPRVLFPFLEKEMTVLRHSHPKAQMWISPQGFTKAWLDDFLDIVQNQKPSWLTGVVFAPQNRLSLADFRKAIPNEYLIRHYPDITHTFVCQYPVQDWDLAYKLTQDREVINPRPMAYAKIVRWSFPYTAGFTTYSEGVNDDVNKIVWSALGWDPETDVFDILRQYARYFIGLPYENNFAQALLALEKNWQGPLLANSGVATTLTQVQDMEKSASPQVLLNWRFQQLVYRAYYDAYVRQRLIYETDLEERAMEVLRRAEELGASLAFDQAESILDRAVLERVGLDLRGRVSDMAEALYQSIRMQLSVPRFKAIAAGRGGNFDLIDKPLNNRQWLEARFAALRALPDEKERLKGIREILNWTNPGPGGYYDELGNPSRNPHLVRDLTNEFDPENRTNPLLGFTRTAPEFRLSWCGTAESRFEAPLMTHYPNLDPNAQYKVRVVYGGDKFDTKITLLANDKTVVHPWIPKDRPMRPLEFDVPKEATAGGNLTLTWYQEPGRGGAGRGCQVAEVWLIKKAG